MPTLLPTRPAGRPVPQRENFVFKSTLIASALLLAAMVVVTQEFYFSVPMHSLSETEAVLRLAAR